MTVRGDLPREAKLIGFNFAQKVNGIIPGTTIDAVVEVGINRWNGKEEIQMRLVDVAKSGESIVEYAKAIEKELAQ